MPRDSNFGLQIRSEETMRFGAWLGRCERYFTSIHDHLSVRHNTNNPASNHCLSLPHICHLPHGYNTCHVSHMNWLWVRYFHILSQKIDGLQNTAGTRTKTSHMDQSFYAQLDQKILLSLLSTSPPISNHPYHQSIYSSLNPRCINHPSNPWNSSRHFLTLSRCLIRLRVS